MEISLRQLSYFLRLVERGSFTLAAASLDITQPALSIAISQLEKSLGVPLFLRTSYPPQLTEFGETLHRYALQIRHDLQNAQDEIAALNKGTIGRLNLCMGPSAAGEEIGAVLSSMVSEFPGADIQVFTGVLPAVSERIRSGEFSVYIGTVGPDFAHDDLEVTPLGHLKLRIIAGSRHPLAGRSGVRADEIVRFPLLAIGDLDINLPTWRTPFHDADVTPPAPALRVRDLTLVRTMLMNGEFLTIMPISMAHTDIQAGSLSSIDASGFDWSLDLMAVTRSGAVVPAAAKVFMNRVAAAFSNGKSGS